ncbi:V-type proton ATPase 116 kDa subunit a 1-like [Oscarella lobularis]|uniref:V-type proton ATPase 116 kDa subunit a 1-like n=1 Tax=Oscarella lobularis TaxID=121494 RepID=UPI0033144C86
MSIFRSEEMTLSQIFLQSESAYTIVSELGELGAVQFRDLNPDVNAFQRKFVNEVRRCDEMERTLRFLNKEIEKSELWTQEPLEYPDAPNPQEMIDLENKFEQLESEMREINANQERLNRNYLELMELKQILSKTSTFFDEAGSHQADFDGLGGDDHSALLGDEGSAHSGQLSFVAGVILRERVPGFERLLWRACRGNVFLRHTEIEYPMEDPVTGDVVHKCVFIIFFQGDQLRSRVKKICEGYRATLYPCPDSPAERREMAMGVATRIEDLKTVLGQTQDHRCRVLQTVSKSLRSWEVKVKKIKAIYHTLNLCNFDLTTKCLIGECWCPVSDLDSIRLAIRRGTERSGSSVPSVLNRIPAEESPPTFFRTNKFTKGFQNIVEAYGIANYREANPALFVVITFPFLFAIMFGDCGHGLIMALFALTLILKEKTLLKNDLGDMFATIFAGRYVIFLMGLFSMYTGLIYNDCFSKSFDVFGSRWILHFTESDYKRLNASGKVWQLNPIENYYNGSNSQISHSQAPYPFGMDPIWQETLSENAITFTNTFKMKMSVIIGVIHMTFGIFLSLTNHLFFKNYISIIGEFIPQLLFLMSLFGYLCILILYKWTLDVTHHAPSLLITLINMFLKIMSSPCSNDGDPNNTRCLYSPSVQIHLQRFLVFMIVICVPWMLLTKPLYLRWKNKKKMREYRQSPYPDTVGITESEGEEDSEIIHHDDDDEDGRGKDDKKDDFQFSEIFVHQAIHTIEFCLGCISHTASYLRLWALSLAHAELSNVLWKMVMNTVMTTSFLSGVPLRVVGLFFGFSFWAILTVAILLIMEGLSAFLHTLRLHWVEFQSKFYGGDGYKFAPFSFTAVLEGEDEV